MFSNIITLVLMRSLLLGLITVSVGWANDSMVAAVVGGTNQMKKEVIIFRGDVKKYLEETYLGDQEKISLFTIAGDYKKYLIEKNKWINRKFDLGLKEIVYLEVIKEVSRRKSHYGGNYAFSATVDEAYSFKAKMLNNALKPIMKRDKNGIGEATISFGNDLIKRNYPHKQGETGKDVYTRWLEDNKRIINRKLVNRGVQVWRDHLIGEKLSRKSIQHDIRFKVMSTYREIMKKIRTEFESDKLTSKDVEKIIRENSSLKVLIKNINNTDLYRQSASSIKENFPDKFENIKSILAMKLSSYNRTLGSGKLKNLIQKAFSYIGQIKNVSSAEKHEKLIEKSKKQLELFVQKDGDFRNYTLSILYKLASELSLSKDNEAEVIDSATEAMGRALPVLIETLKSDSFLINDDQVHYNLSSLVSNIFHGILVKEYPSVRFTEESVFRHIVDLTTWLIEYETQVFSIQYKSKVVLKLYSLDDDNKADDLEVFKRIEDYLFNEEAHRIIETFHQREIYKYWNRSISIHQSSGKLLTGNRAIDFVLKK